MFSRHSVQIAALFSDVFGKALPNLCRSFYNETKAEMFFSVFAVALLAEGVDRNLVPVLGISQMPPTSPSSRRAWIEICSPPVLPVVRFVALLAEGVDRNSSSCWANTAAIPVALLAEGVDRNSHHATREATTVMVALLAEGVDRNPVLVHVLPLVLPSPSSRRAWIEINSTCWP